MTRRASFRFLGDQEALVVHDLDREDEENCQVQPLLRAGRGITFRPDRIVEATRRGFAVCEFCIGEAPGEEPDVEPPDTLREPAFRDRAHPATP
ncbi:MAG TPA: hypothetical protein VFZ12_00510 [Dehalococcoidia bacterium]|nr:hypothetical protein [Dehalococcoidia bacterium]